MRTVVPGLIALTLIASGAAAAVPAPAPAPAAVPVPAPAPAAACSPVRAAGLGRAALAEAVERTLDSYPLDAVPLTRERALSAPATGGLFGWISLRASAWLLSLDGKMSDNGNEAIDFRGDLGLDSEEQTVMPQLQLSLGGVGIRFDTFLVSFNGSSTISRDVTFGGFTFAVNENVTSHVKINNFRLFSMVPIAKTGFFSIAILGGVSYFQLEGEVVGETTGRASESQDAPIPVGGVLLQTKIGRVMFELDAVGLAIDFGSVNATVLDIQVSAGLTIFKFFSVRAGYRYVDVDATVDSFHLEATLDGFFVGISAQF